MAKKSRKAAEISIDINANVAQLAKDMKKVASELDGLGRKVGSLQKIVAASFSFDVLKSAFPYLKQAATAIGDLAERGEKFGSVAESFEALGGSASEIEKAQKAVLGVVDSFTLMQIANEGLLKQIPGFADNFGKIADLGNRVADSLGIEATEGIKQVTDALATAADKQLAAIGVTISADEAYRKYGEAVGIASDKLSDAQKLEARQIAAIEALDGALLRLPESTDSVANALGALQAGFTEALNQFSIGINSSEELREEFRQLGEAIGEVDWEEFGGKVANFVSIIVDAVGTALPYITGFFESIMDGFALIDRTILEAKANGISNSMGRARESLDKESAQRDKVKELEKYVKAIEDLEKKALGAKTKKQAEDLKPVLVEYVKIWEKMGDSAPGIRDNLAEVWKILDKQSKTLPETATVVRKYGSDTTKVFEDQAKAAQKAQKEIDKINEAWSKYVNKQKESAVENADLATISDADFADLKAKMEEAVRSSFYEEWKEKIALGGQNYEDVMKAADKEVHDAGVALDQKRAEEAAQKKREEAAKTERELNQVYGQLSDIGNQMGVDLSGIFDVVSEKFGKEMTDLMGTIGEQLGMTGAEFAGYMNVVLEGIGLALNAKGIDKANKSNKGTGEAAGYAVGAGIGAYFGGPAGAQLGGEIGKVIGGAIGDQFKWGPQNKDTRARHVFANWLEEQLGQLKAVTLMDSQGKFTTMRGNLMNFVEGDTGRFNTPGWADEMQKWGDSARGMFDGLGNALKGLLGITEDVGGQIAYLLGTNLAGNIDNARLLVYQLGLSMEDLNGALLDLAKKGEITWQQYAANVAGVAEAFKPGLSALNDMTGAVNQLIGSGGRGMAALKGVKDIVIEAMEGGAKTLEDLRGQLVKGGMKPEDADKFVQALRASGVRTLEEVKNMSEAQLGQIVASIGNSVDAINEKWKEIGTNLEKIKWDMDKLPTEKDIKINFRASFDDNMEKAKDAGLLDPSGSSDFGEVTPPNTASAKVDSSQMRMAALRARGEGGGFKAQSFNISIDAKGADAGVEDRIYRVVSTYKDMIAQQAASIVIDNQVRGGG